MNELIFKLKKHNPIIYGLVMSFICVILFFVAVLIFILSESNIGIILSMFSIMALSIYLMIGVGCKMKKF